MRNMVGGGMLFYHMIRNKNKKRKTNKRRVKRLLRQTFQDRVTSLVSCSHIQKQLYYKFFATTSVTCTFDFGKIFTTTSFFLFYYPPTTQCIMHPNAKARPRIFLLQVHVTLSSLKNNNLCVIYFLNNNLFFHVTIYYYTIWMKKIDIYCVLDRIRMDR